MKFVMFFKVEEQASRKERNIHHLQVIHDFHTFIEFSLVNVYEFIRNHEHPFDYDHVNDTLYFVLSLYTELISKFKSTPKNMSWESPNSLVLLKPSIIDLLYNITIVHSKYGTVDRESDEFILSVEETVAKIVKYLMQ